VSQFIWLVRRDLALALRGSSDASVAIMFFIVVVVLFPLGIGSELSILKRIGPTVIWIGALLSCLLSLERLFLDDFEDGALDLLVLSPLSLEVVVLAKVLAHWLVTGLPLAVITPLTALLLHLAPATQGMLVMTLLCGTPTLSLIGAIGAALVLGANRGGVLLSLLILPLFIPVLVFSVAAVDAAEAGLPTYSHLLLLVSLLAFSISLAPITAAAALRQAME
jgi:heme exporter protein B